MVTSTHWLASQTGMAILELGGNAFDAAVAAGFVLQVVEPHMNGPGGEVPILVSPVGEHPVVVAGQGCAPAAASIAAFRELGLDTVPGTGHLPACVPGAFDAWLTLLEHYGTLPLRTVLEPAIGYAADGYPATEPIVHTIGSVADVFATHWPTSAAVYLPTGSVPRTGTRLRNPALADCYGRVLAISESRGADRYAQIARARGAFYRGFVAEAIGEFLDTPVMDATGRPHRGLLTAEDLAHWSTPVEEPAWLDYHGYRVFKTGPWGQGPVFLQQLALLEDFDLATMDPSGPEFVHLVVECAKLAFADREAWYGDPAFVDVPLATLLSPRYAAARRRLIGTEAAGDLRPGRPDDRLPVLPARLAVADGPVPKGDTCHLDAVDRYGNMVSATPSGGWLQSAPVVPGLGFCLTTRGQMFWLDPGLASSLAPGKRPRTTLSPSLAWRDGEPALAFGTPGGDQQDQWTLLAFLRHVHHGLDLQEAIEAPGFHSNHMPSSFWPRERRPLEMLVETRLPVRTRTQLRAQGHEVVEAGAWTLGRVTAVGMGEFLTAAADPRGAQAYAVGR